MIDNRIVITTTKNEWGEYTAFIDTFLSPCATAFKLADIAIDKNRKVARDKLKIRLEGLGYTVVKASSINN